MENRSIRLCNRINVVLIFLSLILLMFLLIVDLIEHSILSISLERAIYLIIIAFINLYLSYKRLTFLSKLSTVFAPIVIFILYPTFIGFVEEESFIYYPYLFVTFSIIPQLLFSEEKEKVFYWISIILIFVLTVTIDMLLEYFSLVRYPIIDRIRTFYIYNKLAQILIFILVHMSISYLKEVNKRFEEEIQKTNITLTKKSFSLAEKNSDLEAKHKELAEKNMKLEILRNELQQQNIELEQALKDLKEMQAKLIQSEKMASLGILTAGVAHEINNPLNYISGGLAMLEMELIAFYDKNNIVKEAAEKHNEGKLHLYSHINMIKDGIEKVNNIVEQLKLYSYTSPKEKIYLDAHIILKSAVKFIKRKIPKDINLNYNFKLIEKVPVFPDSLQQVFLNIIDNAIYALNEINISQKELSITTCKVDSFAHIQIINNGPQIPKDVAPKIFDPFFTTKSPGVGTGLGLSISYNIIREHQGELEVINESGKVGFLIKIPLNNT